MSDTVNTGRDTVIGSHLVDATFRPHFYLPEPASGAVYLNTQARAFIAKCKRVILDRLLRFNEVITLDLDQHWIIERVAT
jgi:hypothetical protein